MIIILVLVLVLLYMYIRMNIVYENYMVYWSGPPIDPYIPEYPYVREYPFWNSRIGQTTNMSYDLRGDPIIIPKYPFMWNYSTLTPIYNRSLN